MQSAIATIESNVEGPTCRLGLWVTDPEVVGELLARDEGAARDLFAKRALRVGVLAMRQASGALDAQTIQREGDRLVSSVREVLTQHASQTSSNLTQLLASYLDPASGTLPQRLERLVKRDGEIESLLAKHLDGDRSTVAQTLARQIGEESALFKILSPGQAGGIVATLTAALETALRSQREEVLREFSRDRPDSALSRLVADMSQVNTKLRGDLAGDLAAVTKALSLENDEAPLSRFVRRIEEAQGSILEQFSFDCEGSAIRRLSSALDTTRATLEKSLTLDDKASPLALIREELMTAVSTLADGNARFQNDVRTTLATFRVRREEAARSSAHGHTFEYAAGELLRMETQRTGDLCERLAGTPGKEGRKVGDYVVTMGPESAAPGGRIVCECKADRGYSEAKALDEIAFARKNREAQVGIFIVARETAHAFGEDCEPMRRVGMDLLVVWDAEDPGFDIFLKAAISVARALVVKQHGEAGRAEADVRGLEESIRVIEQLATTAASIEHDAQMVVKRGTKIRKSAGVMRERLGEEVEKLRAFAQRSRASGGVVDALAVSAASAQENA